MVEILTALKECRDLRGFPPCQANVARLKKAGIGEEEEARTHRGKKRLLRPGAQGDRHSGRQPEKIRFGRYLDPESFCHRLAGVARRTHRDVTGNRPATRWTGLHIREDTGAEEDLKKVEPGKKELLAIKGMATQRSTNCAVPAPSTPHCSWRPTRWSFRSNRDMARAFGSSRDSARKEGYCGHPDLG